MGASESKLAFKEDIFRLAGDENIPIDSQWWSRFLQLPETAEDVQNLWSANDLRSLTLNTPADRPLHSQSSPRKNAETLIYRTIGRLHALQTRRVYDDPHAPITLEVLNGVRVLTRLLPYIYEADHLNDWEAQFFWAPRKPAEYVNPKSGQKKYFDGLNETKTVPEQQKDAVLGPPLGEQLLDILINYLFFPNFTLPPRNDDNGLPELKPKFVVWQSGIGANKGVGMSKENERNAMEVLRLLLALSSRAMYLAPGIVAEKDVKPLTYLTTQSDRQVILNTLCSLLNTVLKYHQNPWGFSIDLSAANKDSKQALVTYSLQFLLVLITYPVPNNGANEFRKALGRLHRAEDFQFICEGLRQILMQPTSGIFRPVQRLTNQPAAPIAPETLSLFWELLQCNKRFRSYLIDTDRAKDFVVLVLYYAVEAKDDPSRQGIVRMCVFILQTLSVEEKFGKKLNTPFTFQETLPPALQIPNFHGSYADFLIGHIHTLLTGSNRGLESLHPALLAIINNIAPYVQDLQRATSSMLLNAFVSMSQPSFLLANETNYVLLFSLLDAMNALLEHQQEENRRFVDAVVRSRKRFEALRDFTVDGALEELDRSTKERKDAGEFAGVRSPIRNASLDSARATRSPALSNVPEDSAFAIGDDEDEDDEATPSISSHASASVAVPNDALPLQSRSMSEKARGKQPAGLSSFSRSTSQNTSTTSLHALNTHTSNTTYNQSFSPTAEWRGGPRLSTSDPSTNTTTPATATTAKHADLVGAPPSSPSEVKVQTFRWTARALGWYASMLWGWVYAADPARVWAGTAVRLFAVRAQRREVSLKSPRGAVDAVGDTIARRIGGLSLPGGGGGGGGEGGRQTMREV
ncbi:uncharacterized protein LTR77_008278 [Saxophila tyrrhenica]|uniref:Uncharacterized protein n=1 Tax=Saxophila tyrrhenica TaxID=1690608 RepID=A0AAV9P6D0_9PEZI|nr:hypothetical protein LTR77_008278 [Saxophila tyrrhenica]